MRSRLLYVPAGLTEIYPHMKYQLATFILPWPKILIWSSDGRTYVRTHVWTTQTLYVSGGRGGGHKNILDIKRLLMIFFFFFFFFLIFEASFTTDIRLSVPMFSNIRKKMFCLRLSFTVNNPRKCDITITISNYSRLLFHLNLQMRH